MRSKSIEAMQNSILASWKHIATNTLNLVKGTWPMLILAFGWGVICTRYLVEAVESPSFMVALAVSWAVIVLLLAYQTAMLMYLRSVNGAYPHSANPRPWRSAYLPTAKVMGQRIIKFFSHPILLLKSIVILLAGLLPFVFITGIFATPAVGNYLVSLAEQQTLAMGDTIDTPSWFHPVSMFCGGIMGVASVMSTWFFIIPFGKLSYAAPR